MIYGSWWTCVVNLLVSTRYFCTGLRRITSQPVVGDSGSVFLGGFQNSSVNVFFYCRESNFTPESLVRRKDGLPMSLSPAPNSGTSVQPERKYVS